MNKTKPTYIVNQNYTIVCNKMGYYYKKYTNKLIILK